MGRAGGMMVGGRMMVKSSRVYIETGKIGSSGVYRGGRVKYRVVLVKELECGRTYVEYRQMTDDMWS